MNNKSKFFHERNDQIKKNTDLNILALNTSSSSGSIAVFAQQKIAFQSLLDIKLTHSERLLPQIDAGLCYCSLKPEDIDLILIANGPGSFTGLRIGLATAKGLCLAHDIPLIPFNTLDVIAFNFFNPSFPVLVINDAKMNEIYTALYDKQLTILSEPSVCKPSEFSLNTSEEVIIAGDGFEKYSTVLAKNILSFQRAPSHLNIPWAATMIGMFLDKFKIPDYNGDQIATLEPWYLRKSQAEINRDIKRSKQNG